MGYTSRRKFLQHMAGVSALAGIGFSRTAFARAPEIEISADEREAMAAIANGYLAEYGAPGLSVAIAQHGRLAYAQGFGLADPATGEKVTPATSVPHRQRQQAGDVGDGVFAGRAGPNSSSRHGVRPCRHPGERLRDAEGQAHPGDHHRASADPHLRRLAEQGPRSDVPEPADGSAPADRLDARERAARLIRPAPLMRIRTSATACSVASSRS